MRSHGLLSRRCCVICSVRLVFQKRQMRLVRAVSPVQCNPVIPPSLIYSTLIYPTKNICCLGLPDERDLLCWAVAAEG